MSAQLVPLTPFVGLEGDEEGALVFVFAMSSTGGVNIMCELDCDPTQLIIPLEQAGMHLEGSQWHTCITVAKRVCWHHGPEVWIMQVENSQSKGLV